VSGLGGIYTQRRRIAALAAEAKLPAIYLFREFAEAGGLISYGHDLREMGRGAAEYIARIFGGEKPSDMPFQLPSRYQLVINVKAAKAIGLDVPVALLARADEVIE
jgi:putative ABC transport system substrate-binding protein